MNQSTELKDLFTALTNAQAEMKGALKDSANPFFKSKFADLESCWEAARGPLAKNGLSVIQTMDNDGPHDFLVTTLGHLSGQWLRGKLRVAPTKPNDPQAMGSAITYARRYSFAAIIGLVQTDDDAEAVMGRANKAPRPNVNPMGIHPEDPGEGNGVVGHTSYKITFGKYAQRSLEEVGAENLKAYVFYLEAKAKKDGKPIIGQVGDFIARASEYIGACENDAIEDINR